MKSWQRRQIDIHADQLKFQEKRIEGLEARLESQEQEVKKQKEQIAGWIKRSRLDPSGKMT